MKIVFVCTSFRLPGSNVKVGGGEISNRILLQELAKKNDVVVISAFGNGLWGDNRDGLCLYDFYHYISSTWLPEFVKRILCSLALRFFSCFLIKRMHPDVVLCATYTVPVALKYKRKRGGNVPVGVMVRAFENFARKGWRNKVKDFLKKCLYGGYQEKKVRNMDFVVSNSDYVKKVCEDSFPGLHHYVVYPPVDITRHDIPHGGDIKKIGMVSNRKEKGFDTFFEIARSLPELEFVVYGCPDVGEGEKMLENLTLKGWVDNPEDFLREIDLVLVPSIWEEAFGRISVEASLFGKRVLVSDRGGLPETVGYQEALIIDPEKPELWCERIKSLQSNNELYQQFFITVAKGAEKFSSSIQSKNLEGYLHEEFSFSRSRSTFRQS